MLLIIPLLVISVFFFTTLLGYLIHWFIHQPIAGRFYRSHLAHHNTLYPPDDLVSDAYRDAKGDNTVWVFAIFATPIVVSIVLLTLFSIIPIFYAGLTLGEIGLISGVYNSLHDALHLKKTWWSFLPWFETLQRLHFIHHFHQDKNYGIFWFGWDKVFGSYQDNIER